MNTREKIIEASRILFNTYGIKPVTARRICKQVNISLGSFSYYFPDRSKIITELYASMLDQIMHLTQVNSEGKLTIYQYLELMRKRFLIQLKYKFFYLNLFEILSMHSEVRGIYHHHMNMERDMLLKMIKRMSDGGSFKQDLSPDEIIHTIDTGQILNNSWLIDAEIVFPNIPQQALYHYMKLCCGTLKSWLTESEKEVFTAYFEQLEGE